MSMNKNSIVSNTTKGRCQNDADVLIEAGISFRFEHLLSDAYVLFVADDDLIRASKAIKDARDGQR